MNIRNLISVVFGFLQIVLTLALAPSIQTANTVIEESSNATSLFGMSIIAPFGGPLIIIGLLFSGTMFIIAGVRGKTGGASIKDLIGVVASAIAVILMLTMMVSVVDYNYALWTASDGFAKVLYSIISLIVYLGVVGSVGVYHYKTYRKGRGKSRRSALGNF